MAAMLIRLGNRLSDGVSVGSLHVFITLWPWSQSIGICRSPGGVKMYRFLHIGPLGVWRWFATPWKHDPSWGGRWFHEFNATAETTR